MTKQTVVEWYANKVLSYKNSTNINGTDYIMIPVNKVEHLKQQAKEMEKEQIVKAVNHTIENIKLDEDKTGFIAQNGDGYFNETY